MTGLEISCYRISFLTGNLYSLGTLFTLTTCNKNNVCYSDFFLKVTKLLSKLPRPSGKHNTFFKSSTSKLVFWIFQIFLQTLNRWSALIFFWRALIKFCLNSFLKSLFFATLGILSAPLFLWLEEIAFCTLSNTFPLFAISFPLNRYLNRVYRQSTC